MQRIPPPYIEPPSLSSFLLQHPGLAAAISEASVSIRSVFPRDQEDGGAPGVAVVPAIGQGRLHLHEPEPVVTFVRLSVLPNGRPSAEQQDHYIRVVNAWREKHAELSPLVRFSMRIFASPPEKGMDPLD